MVFSRPTLAGQPSRARLVFSHPTLAGQPSRARLMFSRPMLAGYCSCSPLLVMYMYLCSRINQSVNADLFDSYLGRVPFYTQKNTGVPCYTQKNTGVPFYTQMHVHVLHNCNCYKLKVKTQNTELLLFMNCLFCMK